MADLPAGVLAKRDPETHARVLGPYSMPSMPGAFNAVVGDVSKRAGARAGTIAERDQAMRDGECFEGMQWVVIPDVLNGEEYAPRPTFLTGNFWYDPARRRRGLFIPRSLKTTVPTVGILGNTLTPIVNGIWSNAPGGSYNVDFSATLDAANAAGMTLQGIQNSKSLREDYDDDISKSKRNYKFDGFIEDHPGGDLTVQLAVLINGTTGTVYTKGTGVRLTYLGPFLHG